MPNNRILNAAVENIKGQHVLVTGGAGFIGSNLVGYLLDNSIKVTVLDNLITGKAENLAEFNSNSNFKFIEGDITDTDTCLKAMEGVDIISHQAALDILEIP